MADSLLQRLERIHAALAATAERDLSRFTPDLVVTPQGLRVSQQFRAGLSDAELLNLAHSLIANIASLQDHARRAFKERGIEPAKADEIATDPAIAVIRDLFDLDKHGPKTRAAEKGWSGLQPTLGPIQRVMSLRSSGGKAGWTVVSFRPSGVAKMGSGSVDVVVTADVLDPTGRPIGDLQTLCRKAVQAWEGGLAQLGFGPLGAP